MFLTVAVAKNVRLKKYHRFSCKSLLFILQTHKCFPKRKSFIFVDSSFFILHLDSSSSPSSSDFTSKEWLSYYLYKKWQAILSVTEC